MAKQRRQSFRLLVRRVHLWMGLTLGIYMAVMGITGSILVFGEELEPALNPDLHHVEPTGEPMPWQDAIAAVQQAYPDARITRVLAPPKPDRAIVFWLGKWNGSMPMAYVDPYTGRVVGEDTLGGSLIGWMRYFHIYLYAGPTGFLINGIAGLCTMGLLATGLYLWWPNPLRLVWRRLWVKWRAPWARVNWDLHHAIGGWSLPLLALIVLTGVVFPFHGQVDAAVRWLLPEPDAEVADAATLIRVDDTAVDDEPPTLEQLVQTACAAVPGGRLVLLSSADRDDRPLSAMLMNPGGENWYRYTMVTVDRETARVTDIRRQDSAADNVMSVMYPLHTGRFGGVWTKALFVFIGLTPAVLLITGTTIRLRRGRN